MMMDADFYNSCGGGGDDDLSSSDSGSSSVVVVHDQSSHSRSPSHHHHNWSMDPPGYVILSDHEIGERLEAAVSSLAPLLSVSRSEACMLLLQFSWSVEKAHDRWFGDEDKVRLEVGVLHPAPNSNSVAAQQQQQQQQQGGGGGTLSTDSSLSSSTEEQRCGVCLDFCPVQEMRTTPYCAHHFCNDCLGGYFSAAIAEGPRCLTLRCAEHKCKAAVGQDLVRALVTDAEWARYTHFLHKSFVESQRSMSWCPAVGCSYAAHRLDGEESDIQCKCGHRFCGDCLGEPHRPIDCATVVKWTRKTDADGGSVSWKLANSKPCPKCKRPIQKHHGCNHMTCTPPCGHHFCWLCLGDFADYSHACNRFAAKRNKDAADSDRASMLRYAHYYERFATNESSGARAAAELAATDEAFFEGVMSRKGVLESLRLKSGPAPAAFIPRAMAQVVEGRRVLKWSYAYGYYHLLDDDDHGDDGEGEGEGGSSSSNKARLFECLQGEAEFCLEKLHHLVEEELNDVLQSPPHRFEDDFMKYRFKLVTATVATKTYFENLVAALQNGLVDAVVDNRPSRSQTSSSPRKRAKHPSRRPTSRVEEVDDTQLQRDYDRRPPVVVHRHGNRNRNLLGGGVRDAAATRLDAAGGSEDDDDDDMEEEPLTDDDDVEEPPLTDADVLAQWHQQLNSDVDDLWQCPHCTLTNYPNTVDCEACGLPRRGGF